MNDWVLTPEYWPQFWWPWPDYPYWPLGLSTRACLDASASDGLAGYGVATATSAVEGYGVTTADGRALVATGDDEAFCET